MTRNRENEIINASIEYANEEFPEHEFVWNCFASGAEWADKTMIDKACRWLDQQLFIKYDSDAVTRFINDFRKAMEE